MGSYDVLTLLTKWKYRVIKEKYLSILLKKKKCVILAILSKCGLDSEYIKNYDSAYLAYFQRLFLRPWGCLFVEFKKKKQKK